MSNHHWHIIGISYYVQSFAMPSTTTRSFRSLVAPPRSGPTPPGDRDPCARHEPSGAREGGRGGPGAPCAQQ